MSDEEIDDQVVYISIWMHALFFLHLFLVMDAVN